MNKLWFLAHIYDTSRYTATKMYSGILHTHTHTQVGRGINYTQIWRDEFLGLLERRCWYWVTNITLSAGFQVRWLQWLTRKRRVTEMDWNWWSSGTTVYSEKKSLPIDSNALPHNDELVLTQCHVSPCANACRSLRNKLKIVRIHLTCPSAQTV